MQNFDKYLHFSVMFIIETVAIALSLPMLTLIALPVIAGVGKELYDRFVQKEYISLLDIAATIIGGFIPLLILPT